MHVFVYYSDGYYVNGDVGFEEFDSRESAEAFIAQRLAQSLEPNIKNYQAIEGKLLSLETVSVVARVKLNDARTA